MGAVLFAEGKLGLPLQIASPCDHTSDVIATVTKQTGVFIVTFNTTACNIQNEFDSVKIHWFCFTYLHGCCTVVLKAQRQH